MSKSFLEEVREHYLASEQKKKQLFTIPWVVVASLVVALVPIFPTFLRFPAFLIVGIWIALKLKNRVS